MASSRRTCGCVALALALTAHSLPAAEVAATHRHRGTATIDGVEGEGEWTGALVGLFPLRLPQKLGGQESMVPFYVMNDDEFLYLAARIEYGKSPRYPYWLSLHSEAWAGVPVCTQEPYLDAFTTWSFDGEVHFRDWFIVECDNLYPDYAAATGTVDTLGAWAISDGTTFFEMAQPLDSSDDRFDLNSPPPGLISLSWTAGGGNDYTSDWGWLAQGIVKVFLLSSDTLLYADFEGGDLSEWSSPAP